MSRKSAISKNYYEHVDFNDLLNELKENKMEVEEVEDTAIVHTIFPQKSEMVIPETEFRHKIMSDQKIRYLYSKNEQVIHEKHCIHAKEISDQDLQWSWEYISELQRCSDCEVAAYINYGAKDPEEIEKYEDFFRKTKMSLDQIRKMYIVYGMKTRIYSDTMTIWCKQDVWRMKALPKKGRVQLYHNNYIIRKKGVREFTKGFHIQNLQCEDTNITYALNLICNYEYIPEEWAFHQNNKQAIERMKEQKLQENDNVFSLEVLLSKEAERENIWYRIKYFVKKLFRKKTVFDTYGFRLVSEYGYPKNKTLCIYIWKDKNEKIFWQTGRYDQDAKQFSVKYGDVVYAIRQTKVVAWKSVTAETMEIAI